MALLILGAFSARQMAKVTEKSSTSGQVFWLCDRICAAGDLECDCDANNDEKSSGKDIAMVAKHFGG